MKPRRTPPQKYGIAYWIEHEGRVWLVRRPASGLLGGMAALPGTDWTEAPPSSGKAIAAIRHVFTHFSLDLSIELGAEAYGQGWWQPIGALGEAGLPTLYRKGALELLRGRRSLAA